MPRFVILRHEPGPHRGRGRALHWDFMLEQDDRLGTWALAEEPSWGRTIDACQLPDHRKAYLDYEGPVSGGRGAVSQWDQGDFFWLQQSSDRIVIRLSGHHLQGRATLVRTARDPQRWTVFFGPKWEEEF